VIRFGISKLTPEGTTDEEFLDSLLALDHDALELPFVNGFPWKEKRCERFGELAADRGIALSIHAPYFAILTQDDPDTRPQTLSALEHSMKLVAAMGGHTVVAHTGYVRDRTADELHELVDDGLRVIAPKVRHLGVALGLETSGSDRAFGSLGDIALIAQKHSFVRPVIDWAHVHAKSGGALVDAAAFASVIGFLRSEFPGWSIDPLHTQFTDNEFGAKGEIRHVPYGTGSLRSGPLAEAAVAAGLRMIVISEAKEDESHAAILTDLRAAEQAAQPDEGEGRPAASGLVDFPEDLRLEPEADAFLTIGTGKRVRITNPDKVFFPDDGYTKGDLLSYYHSVAPLLVPHLAGKALSLSRYPDGIDGNTFYEKRTPSHAPDWIVTAPMPSGREGGVIPFVTVSDVESLLWVVNLGAIEMHAWLSRVDRADLPDVALFDLDPQDGCPWDRVTYVAGLINVLLERLGLAGYPKTSGNRGLHIHVPLDPIHSYARVRRFVDTIGTMLATADPEAVTMEWDKAKRGPKVFVDANQNVGGKNTAAVYSVRPVPGAQVSMPLLWDELDEIEPSRFTIATIWERLRQYGDLFAPTLAGGQQLDAAETALGLPPID
jgi:bifunctional non-homologous end joining protein LigD